MDIQLPTTQHRAMLLRSALKWVGVFYAPGADHEGAAQQAMRAALGLPADGPILRRHFTHRTYQKAMHGFGELVHMALWFDRHGGPDTAEMHAASKVYADTPPGTVWLGNEAKTLEVMVDTLRAWCLEMGLAQAMSDIDVAANADFDSLLKET